MLKLWPHHGAAQTLLLLSLLFSLSSLLTATSVPASKIVFTGSQAFNVQEFSVNSAGDINGDGFHDLAIGDYYNNKVYIIFGPVTGVSTFDITAMTTTQGFKVIGIGAPGGTGDRYLGFSVKTTGDVNGDGITDFIIGSPYSNQPTRSNPGCAYVIYGKKTGFSDIDLTSFTPSQGFKIVGEATNDFAGYATSSAGDFNHDGVNDIIIGAQRNGASSSKKGAVYVIFGKVDGISDIDLLTLTSDQGIKITGQSAGDMLGYSVSNAGDFNHDGIDDVVIGALYSDLSATNAGCAYVIFGQRSGLNNLDVTTLTTSQGIRITGEAANHLLGSAVGYAGDFNQDHIDDIVIGAPGGATAYVIFGKAGPSDLSLSALTVSQGFRITGTNNFGEAVSYAGDMDADGIDDVIIGGSKRSQTTPVTLTDAGAVCVVYGKTSGIADLTLNGVASDNTLGYVMLGTMDSQFLGQAVGYAGNIDGVSAHSVVIREKHSGINDGPVTVLTGASYFIYWDYTHLSFCEPPLLSETWYGLLYCIDPCSSDPTDPYQYLYWDGSCQTSCDLPYQTRLFKGRYFCDFPCLLNEYLYPDGICSKTCTLPVKLQVEGSRKVCTVEQDLPTTIIINQKVSFANKMLQIALSIVDFDNPSMVITSIMLKKLLYARYLDIRGTSSLKLLYNNSDASPDCVDLTPEIPGTIANNYNYTTSDILFERYGVGASFLVNYWVALISIPILGIICFLLWICEAFLQVRPKRRILWGVVSKIRIILQNFTLQQFYSTFSDGIIDSILEFRAQFLGLQSFNFSVMIALIWLVLAFSILIYHFILIKRYQKLKKSKLSEEKNKHILRKYVLKNAGFTLLFEDFHDGSFITQSFLLVFMIRAIIFYSLVVLLSSQPFIQVIIFIILGLLMLVFLLRSEPHRKRPDFLQNLVLEIIVLTVNFCLLFLNLQDLGHLRYNEIQYYLGGVIFYCNIVGHFVPIVCIGLRIYLVIRNRMKKDRGWKIRVLLNELLDVFMPNPQEGEDVEIAKEGDLEKEKLQPNSSPSLCSASPSPNKSAKITPIIQSSIPSALTPLSLDFSESKTQSMGMNLVNAPISSSQLFSERKRLLKSNIQSQFSQTPRNLRMKDPLQMTRETSKLSELAGFGGETFTPVASRFKDMEAERNSSTSIKIDEDKNKNEGRKDGLTRSKGISALLDRNSGADTRSFSTTFKKI